MGGKMENHLKAENKIEQTGVKALEGLKFQSKKNKKVLSLNKLLETNYIFTILGVILNVLFQINAFCQKTPNCTHQG